MNLPEINTNLFKQLRFILVETSRAGNIGAVARAMKTMGKRCKKESQRLCDSPVGVKVTRKKCAKIVKY